jgi:hypothetical protein
MKLSTLMATKSVICLVFGVILGLAPGAVLAIFGVKNVDSSLIFMSRLSGAIFVLLGLLLWFAKNDPGSVALRGILLAVAIGDGFAFLVTLIGQLGNVMNALGWLVVALYLLLSFGFGYFYLRIAKPSFRSN